jgi:hypothetical protein
MSEKRDNRLEDLPDEVFDGVMAGDDDLYDLNEADVEDWQDSPSTKTTAAQKKNGSFTYMIIGIGVLVAVGMAYSQMQTQPMSQPITEETLQNNTTPPVIPVKASTPPVLPPPVTQTMNMPTSATAIPNPVQDIPVQPTLPGAEPLTPMPDFVAVPSPTPISQAPTIPTSVAVAPVAPQQPTISPLTSMVDNAQLQKTEAALTDLQAKLAAQPDTTALQAQIENLNSTISELRNRITELENKPAAHPEPTTPARSTTPPAAVPVTTTNTYVAPAPQPTGPSWILRAASADIAYISKTRTGPLTTVQVGDKIEGLGTIQSISFENNRWIVKGTQRRIRQ